MNIYQSTPGNCFYVKIKINRSNWNAKYKIIAKTNWKDLWTSLDTIIKERILITNGYYNYFK